MDEEFEKKIKVIGSKSDKNYQILVEAFLQLKEDWRPPISTLTCFEGQTPEEVEELLLADAKTLSRALGIVGNIFMSYHEAKSGEVISGNGVVRK